MPSTSILQLSRSYIINKINIQNINIKKDHLHNWSQVNFDIPYPRNDSRYFSIIKIETTFQNIQYFQFKNKFNKKKNYHLIIQLNGKVIERHWSATCHRSRGRITSFHSASRASCTEFRIGIWSKHQKPL